MFLAEVGLGAHLLKKKDFGVLDGAQEVTTSA
jgi:hypothetical protein